MLKHAIIVIFIINHYYCMYSAIIAIINHYYYYYDYGYNSDCMYSAVTESLSSVATTLSS